MSYVEEDNSLGLITREVLTFGCSHCEHKKCCKKYKKPGKKACKSCPKR